MRLIYSTTFQLGVIVLMIGGILAYKAESVTALTWLEKALEFIYVYAAKESIKYGAEAYKGKVGD